MSNLVLIVEIAGRRLGLTATDIHSVIQVEQVTPVPRAPYFVLGLTALRSRALTVIACERALDLPGASDTAPEGPAVVVERGGHLYALRVDSVADVVEAHGESSPVPGDAGAGWARISRGMIETDLGAVLLTEIDGLLGGSDAEAA